MRPKVHHRSAAALLAVPAVAAVALALGSGASAQDPGARTLTFKELDKGSTFTHIRNTRTKSSRANSQGDILAFTSPLADDSGKRIGKLSFTCTTTTGAREFQKSTVTCNGIVALRGGSLMVQVNVTPARSEAVGAVTGGTGIYANARGVVVSEQTRSGAVDTITLAD